MNSRNYMKRGAYYRTVVLVALLTIIVIASTRLRADTGTCGPQMITLPFTDVPSSNQFFCAIAEAYFSGLANGTSQTTYAPSQTVTREQMAAFATRTMDQSLARGSRRAALDQWWIQQHDDSRLFDATTVGAGPDMVKSDGSDLWVANGGDGTVSRVRASDGKLLGTWTGAAAAHGVLIAMGRVFITGRTNPSTGRLYMIDPRQSPGAVITVASNLGIDPAGIAFDGIRIWTTNYASGSVSMINPAPATPWPVTTVTAGFAGPAGILFDGSNIWITDHNVGSLLKLNSDGSIAQTVVLPSPANPQNPVFDGKNIWVPNFAVSNLFVVRANTGTILATLSGNGLNAPLTAAFDGQRVLVTNYGSGTVSLWNATDLAPLTVSSPFPNQVYGACSDGINFWFTAKNSSAAGWLVRF